MPSESLACRERITAAISLAIHSLSVFRDHYDDENKQYARPAGSGVGVFQIVSNISVSKLPTDGSKVGE